MAILRGQLHPPPPLKLADILTEVLGYLARHDHCANALHALGAVCGPASPLYVEARTEISAQLGEQMVMWVDRVDRQTQINRLTLLIAEAKGLLNND